MCRSGEGLLGRKVTSKTGDMIGYRQGMSAKGETKGVRRELRINRWHVDMKIGINALEMNDRSSK